MLAAAPRAVQAVPVPGRVTLAHNVPWTVPAGVEVIRVTLSGAPGGSGDSTLADGGAGGAGGAVSASLTIGSTLPVTVTAFLGQAGADGTASSGGNGGAGGETALAGGNGGTGKNGSGVNAAGGGGGGGGSILKFTNSNGTGEILVAPGGGGGGALRSSGTTGLAQSASGSGTALYGGVSPAARTGGAGGNGGATADAGAGGGGGGGGYRGGLGGNGGGNDSSTYKSGGGGESGSRWYSSSQVFGLAPPAYGTSTIASARVEFVAFNTTSLANGMASTAYSADVDAVFGASSCSFIVSYAASNLPSGLTIDASSGIISGTPTVAGTSTVSITATATENVGGTVYVTARTVTDFALTIDPYVAPPSGSNGGAPAASAVAPVAVPTPTPTATATPVVAPAPTSTIHNVGAQFAKGASTLRAGARRSVATTAQLAPSGTARVTGSVRASARPVDKHLARKRVAAVIKAMRTAGFTGAVTTAFVASSTKGGSRRVAIEITEPAPEGRRLIPRGC